MWTACWPPCPTCTELPPFPEASASGNFFARFRNQTVSASYILIEPVLGEEGDRLDEVTLAKKLRQGSRLALERAIDRFTPYVSAVVVRVLAGRGTREDVEELTADVFLALWAHAGELEPEQGLRPWLGAVARNKAADWLRTHREAVPLPENAAAPGGVDPQGEAERREWAARLWDAVEGLDEPDRTLFLRYYHYGDKLKDIARALGLTQTAAKQRLFRGRKVLRDILTKGGVEA